MIEIRNHRHPSKAVRQDSGDPARELLWQLLNASDMVESEEQVAIVHHHFEMEHRPVIVETERHGDTYFVKAWEISKYLDAPAEPLIAKAAGK